MIRGLTDCSTGPSHPAILGPLLSEDQGPESVPVTADICHPLHSIEDAGVLYARLDVTRLISRALGPIRSGRTGYAWAIDAEGMFLYHPDHEFVGRSAFEARHERQPYISFSEIDHIMRDQMLQGEEGMGIYESGWHRGVEGQIEKLIAFTPVPSAVLGGTHVWSVAVVAPTTEVAEAVRRVYRRQYAAEGALIVGMLVLAALAVADQRRRSAALARQIGRQEEYMLSILNSSADAIVFVDNDNHVQVWNRGAELLFGYTAEEMVGHTFRRLVPPEIDAEAELRRIQEEAARKGFVRDYVATRITKDGQRVTVDITRTPVHSEKGRVIGSTVIIRDVTAKMEWEQRIYHTEKLASIGNLAAGVAHEINNPLAVMLGFTDLLLERAEPGTADYEDLKVIEESGKSARKIVENLLGFARVTEGLEDTVDVHHCIRTVAGIVKNTLMTAKVELVQRGPRGPAPGLRGLARVPAGGLQPHQQRGGGDEGRGGHPDSLCRGGGRPGPPPRDRHRSGDSGPDQGPGLRPVLHHQEGRRGHRAGALALLRDRDQVRRPHELHQLEPRGPPRPALGHDLHGVHARVRPPPDHRPRRGGAGRARDRRRTPVTQRILAVDDEVHMLRLLERIISEKTPYSIVTTNSSLEVPRLLENESFDLILTDLKMPGMDGLDILRTVKEQGRDEEIIILTAFGSLETAMEALTHDVFDYITKPFKKEQILHTVNKAMRWQRLKREVGGDRGAVRARAVRRGGAGLPGRVSPAAARALWRRS